MLGKKFFSILCLLALTVLLGACGSEEQTVAVNSSTPVVTEDIQAGDAQIDTQKEAVASISASSLGEFMALVADEKFVSISNFKSLNGLSSATTVQFYFQKCTGGSADLYDADEDSGFWGNLLDTVTPGVNYGNCSQRFTRTASGEYVTRSDDYLSKSEVLSAMKEIVATGTPIMKMGDAAFSFEYQGSKFTIDLNYPVEVNPMMESSVGSDGETSSNSFIGHYSY